jgi:hypothetical protein
MEAIILLLIHKRYPHFIIPAVGAKALDTVLGNGRFYVITQLSQEETHCYA